MFDTIKEMFKKYGEYALYFTVFALLVWGMLDASGTYESTVIFGITMIWLQVARSTNIKLKFNGLDKEELIKKIRELS